MWAPRRCGCSLTGDMLRHSASHQERLDNPLGGAYVPRPIPLYRRQELDDSPLLQEMCVYDQGRARGQGGSNYSAPEAPDRNGGESLFAVHHRRAWRRGQSGIAGVWQLPASPPGAARRPQPENRGDGADSGETGALVYSGESAPSTGRLPPSRPQTTPHARCTRHSSPWPECLTSPQRRDATFPKTRREPSLAPNAFSLSWLR